MPTLRPVLKLLSTALIFSVGTPVLSSETTSVVLQCDTQQQPLICAALAEGLVAKWPELMLTLVNVSEVQESPEVDPQAEYTIRYLETSRSSNVLSGQLNWQDRAGPTVEGPVAGFSVMDRELQDRDLAIFTETLIETSGLPF